MADWDTLTDADSADATDIQPVSGEAQPSAAPPPFDPTKPFTTAAPAASAPPPFDPSQPFTPAPAQPQWTKEKPFEPKSPTDIDRFRRTAPAGSWLKTPKGELYQQPAPEEKKAAEAPPEEQWDLSGLTPAPKPPGWLGTAVEAGRKGVVQGVTEAAQAPTAFRERPPEAPDTSPVGELLSQPISQGWSDPKWWIAHIAHGAAAAAPSLALGAAGAGAGSMVAGPVGAFAGGVGGFAVGSAVQTLAPAYQKARQEGLDHDAAVARAIKESGIAAGFGAAMGAAPGVALFGRGAEGALKRPISEALAQIFGVQPGLGLGQQVATGAVEGKAPSLDELGTAYAEQVGVGAALVGGHAGARRLFGRSEAPAPGGAEPGVAPAEGGAAPAGVPPVGEAVGLPMGEAGVQRMEVVRHTPDGDVVLRDPEGTEHRMTAADVSRLATEPPPAPEAAAPEPVTPVTPPEPPPAAPAEAAPVPEAVSHVADELDQAREAIESLSRGETPTVSPEDVLAQRAAEVEAEEPAQAPPEGGPPSAPEAPAAPQAPAPPDLYGKAIEFVRALKQRGKDVSLGQLRPVLGTSQPETRAVVDQLVANGVLTPSKKRGVYDIATPEAAQPVAAPEVEAPVQPPAPQPEAAPRQPETQAARLDVSPAEAEAAPATEPVTRVTPEQPAESETPPVSPTKQETASISPTAPETAGTPPLVTAADMRRMMDDALEREALLAKLSPEEQKERGRLEAEVISRIGTEDQEGLSAAMAANGEFLGRMREKYGVAPERRAETPPTTSEAPREHPNAPTVSDEKHTKTGKDIFAVRFPEKPGIDGLGAQAKKIGGYWSSFRGGGMQPGWMFKTREAADRFADWARGQMGATESAKPTAKTEPVTPTPEPTAGENPTPPVLAPDEHPGLVIKGLETGKTTEIQPPGTQPPPPAGMDPELWRLRNEVAKAREETETEPSDAQKEQGNYKKGRVKVAPGLDFVMETPEGSVRRGIDSETGEPFENVSPVDYGYLSKSEAADGEHVDAYLGPDHTSQTAFVIDQVDARTGAYDEAKVMLGFDSWAKARKAYEDAFSDGRGAERIGNVTPMSLDQLRTWLKEGDTKNPVGQQALPLDGVVGRPAEEQPSAPSRARRSDNPQVRVAEEIAERLEKTYAAGIMPVSARELQEIAEKHYGSKLSEGRFTRADLYDALELGVNKYIQAHSEVFDPRADLGAARRIVRELDELKSKLPTQTVRSGEKEKMQQFSTPPDYAYAAAWMAKIGPHDRVIEPSAGTGSLAVMAMNAKPEAVAVNELSAKRAPMVESLGPSRALRENAEQLHNVLPDDIKPTVVLMNPPFSSAGDRMAGKRILDIGAQHVEAALKALEPGGRLVAIVGRGMGQNMQAGYRQGTGAHFAGWWSRIGQEYDVRANVGVPGDVYTKYGTSFGTRLLVIDKNPPSGRPPLIAEARDISDLLNRLSEIRDDRQPIRESSQPLAGEPGREEAPPGGEGGYRPEAPVSGAAVEPGVREGSASAGPGAEVPSGSGVRGGSATRSEPRPGAGHEVAAAEPERPEPIGAERHTPAGAGERAELAGSGAGPDGVVLRPEGSAGSVLPSEREPPSVTPEAVKVDEAAVEPQGGEITENVYEPYRPQRIKIAGAKEHPGALVQSAAMASVMPPSVDYAPRVPKELISKGALSDAQLEAITYAGQAHSQMLPAAEGQPEYRRGFMDGDGTGVGKGRIVAGIILDNWMQGRRKALWISEKKPLLKDAQRDWSGLDQDPKKIFDLSKTKAGEQLKAGDGIAFVTYDTLKSAERMGKDEKGKTIKGKSRLDQLIDWLGADFDGVIAFDESHNLANSMQQKADRGFKEAAQKALAGIELQDRLPKARVVYISATGATEVANLAYAERLGLWGRGTAFPNKAAFIQQIHSGGIAAMELVARDMKAMGSYISRNLSYDGVEYDRVEHTLTPQQKQTYDALAEAWQVVLHNINKALEIISPPEGVDKRAKSAALSAFWGAHQRFFNQIITSMQMPSVIKGIERDLKEGKQAVLQLVNTNEASQKRALAKVGDEAELEDLDMTPRDQLMQMIEHSFPVAQHETYIGENGNERSRVVTDSKGNVVENKEAIAMRERLLDQLGAIKVPDGPLEMLINHFGANKVAEVTGRKQRIVRKEDDKGNVRTVIEHRPASANVTEADAFQNGKKPILVFSEAGGTGRSYHADNTAPSKDARRSHYLVQAGWRADKAIQGFGRTHRTNQASAPLFHLVTTDLQGQRRFISSIARRLAQLGALTKGERRAGEQGLFSARDNLESTEASEALYTFFRDLHFDRVPEITEAEFERQTGLTLTDDQGNLKRELPPIPQFLNRMLSLKFDMQNKVFGAFERRLGDAIDRAAANGALDVGTETLRGDRINKDEERTVHTDPQSGAETKYVRLKVETKNNPADFDSIVAGRGRTAGRTPEFFVQNRQSGKVYAVTEAHPFTDTKSGTVTEQYRLTDPLNYHFVNRSSIEGYGPRAGERWEKIEDPRQARELWDKQIAAVPEFDARDVHLITGAILPIWDRVAGTPKIYRTQTQSGERLLGRVVHEKDIAQTLKALGAEAAMKQYGPAEIAAKILDGDRATLSNGWRLTRSYVANEPRIELRGPSYYERDELERDGVFVERIGYETRFFVPTGERAAEVLSRVLERRPVTEFAGESSGLAEERGGAEVEPARDMRSELADVRRHYPEGVLASHHAARDFALELGRLTGHEYFGGVDATTGEIVAAGTSSNPSEIAFDPETVRRLAEPGAGNPVDLHHNHPGGYPVSTPDIGMLAAPNIRTIIAHNHDSVISAARLTPEARQWLDSLSTQGEGQEALMKLSRHATDIADIAFEGLVESGRITPKQADQWVREASNTALAGAGVIDYMSGHTLPRWAYPYVARAARMLSEWLPWKPDPEAIFDRIHRSAGAVQPEEGLGRLSRPDEGAPAAGRSAGAGGDRGSAARPQSAAEPGPKSRLAEENNAGGGAGEPPRGGGGEPPVDRTPERQPSGDEERAALRRIMHTDDKSLMDRVRTFVASFREDLATKLKQGFLDDTAGLERAERAARNGKLGDASVSPTIMARLTRNLDSVMATVIGVRQGDGYAGGALRYDPKSGAFETAPGSKPFAAVFKPIFDRGLQDQWALWAITNRAKRLKAEGRERNVSEEDIARFSNLDKKYLNADGTNLFQKTLSEWRDLNKATLDLAESVGLINKDQRALWENEDYVPFFRALDDDVVVAPSAGGKDIANIRSGITRLKGGEAKVANIYENMVRNLSSIIDRSMKNEAMRRVVATLSGTEALTPLSKMPRESLQTPEAIARLEAMGLDPKNMSMQARVAASDLFGMISRKDPDLVSVMEGGRPQYYRVNDPLLLRSLVSIGPQAARGAVMTLLGGAKKVLTHAVTIDPAFMAANLLRDSVHSWVVTGHGFTPGADTVRGLVKALHNDPSAMALMAGGGGGGHFYAAAPAHVRRMLEEKSFQNSVLDTPVKIWEALQHIGRASEQANRIAIYEAALKEGASKAEAIARAHDMLNFTMRGDFAAMRFLTETVPFLNARVQGLYRLYRGARDNPASFLMRGGLVTLAAIALWSANKDDERYKALEDWDRQNYFHFFVGDQHFRLPQPFEVGALFAAIPEMLLNFSENGRTKELANAFGSVVLNQLNLNPVPQLIKPALDLYANKDSFTGRPIVNQSEERLLPALQYGPTTSRTVVALAGALGVSPDRAEYLLRGYGGTVATYLLAASDALAESAGAVPPRASRRLDQIPLVSRFVREEPALSSRWITEFYDLKTEAEQLVNSLRQYQKQGNLAAARSILADNAAKIGLYKGTQSLAKQLSAIRRAMTQIDQHPTMAPDEKRRRLDSLIANRNRLVQVVRPMLQRAEGLSVRP